jgi:hypothetical protein
MRNTLLSLGVVILVALPTVRAEDKWVKIALADGKVLSVEDDSQDDGAKVVAVKEGDSKAQNWKIVEDGKFLKIVNRKSGKVLDVNEDSRDAGATIIIYEEKADGTDNQRWSWVGEGKTKQLKSKSSSLILTVDEKGAITQQKADEKSKGQTWTVTDVK